MGVNMISTIANKRIFKTISVLILCVVMPLSLCINANAARIKMIDGVMHRFSADGKNEGRYTGWAKDSRHTYHYKDGEKQTGWVKINGNTHYFNRDGVMRTGWVAIWENKEIALTAYYFDKNGVWDGNAAKPSDYYKPETLGDFLLDHHYPLTGKYDARLWNKRNFVPFSGIKTTLRILEKNSDAKLIYDSRQSDVVIVNNAVYRGNDDLFIRMIREKGELFFPGLHFSKDKAGNSYFYTNYYNFGIKLNDPGAYDTLIKYLS